MDILATEHLLDGAESTLSGSWTGFIIVSEQHIESNCYY